MEWEYITEQGDTWDILALDIYGSESLSYILQSRNPQFIDFIFFPSGIVLIIPQTPALKTNLPVPPWLRNE